MLARTLRLTSQQLVRNAGLSHRVGLDIVRIGALPSVEAGDIARSRAERLLVDLHTQLARTAVMRDAGLAHRGPRWSDIIFTIRVAYRRSGIGCARLAGVQASIFEFGIRWRIRIDRSRGGIFTRRLRPRVASLGPGIDDEADIRHRRDRKRGVISGI